MFGCVGSHHGQACVLPNVIPEVSYAVELGATFAFVLVSVVVVVPFA